MNIGDWIEDNAFGLVVFLVIAALVGVVITALIASKAADEHKKATACAHAIAAARTSADTVAVILKCEMPTESDGTTVVPMPIITPAR